MTLTSGEFYTSGTFWAGAGVVAVILSTVAIAWVTLRAANPKRRLYYWMSADTPLIRRRKDLSSELKVIYGERLLDSPRVVNIELNSRGRLDISREAFDEAKPLCLDIGTSIVECVKVTTFPTDRPDPTWAIEGSKLLLGPSHIGRRQKTVFSLLVDGPSPRLVAPQQSLVDVQLRAGEPQTQWSKPMSILLIPLFAATAAGIVIPGNGKWHAYFTLAAILAAGVIVFALTFFGDSKFKR